MFRRALLTGTILATIATPVLAKKTAAEIMEEFRVLLEKQSYKTCQSKKSLKTISGFCDCYSIKVSDEFNRGDLVYFIKNKKFSADFTQRRKKIALECLREAKK